MIKNYTVVANQAFKEELKVKSNTTTGSIAATAATTQNIAGGGDSFGTKNTGRKGQVVSSPPRHWMGFGVLWQIIQDPEIQNMKPNNMASKYGTLTASQINLSIDLLLELLSKDFIEVEN